MPASPKLGKQKLLWVHVNGDKQRPYLCRIIIMLWPCPDTQDFFPSWLILACRLNQDIASVQAMDSSSWHWWIQRMAASCWPLWPSCDNRCLGGCYKLFEYSYRYSPSIPILLPILWFMKFAPLKSFKHRRFSAPVTPDTSTNLMTHMSAAAWAPRCIFVNSGVHGDFQGCDRCISWGC